MPAMKWTIHTMKTKMSHACVLAAAFGCVATARAALTADLIGYYQFESDLADSSGNGNDATTTAIWNTGTNPSGPGFTGKADFDPGDGLSDRGTLIVGKALNLIDMKDEYITVPFGTSELGQTFTISAWTYLSPGAGNNSSRFHAFESSNNWDVSWGNVNGNTSLMRAYVGQSALSPDSPVTHEVWQHVVHVFTSDGTTTTLNVYVDGGLASTGTVATTSMNFAALHFGRARAGTSDDRHWDGMIDEVAIWDRALDTTEITEVYDAGVAGKPIPEPSSALLIGFGGIAVLLRRRPR